MTDEDLFRNPIPPGKLRKNAASIFLEAKVCDLAAVQRRKAGRRRQIKKICEATEKPAKQNYGKMQSIFLEVKVRDLVAVQRRDAGRRRQNKKIK